MSNLGTQLKAYREKHGLSLNQVSEKTGITNSRLSKIEQQIIEYPPSDLKKLAHLYNADTSFLQMQSQQFSQYSYPCRFLCLNGVQYHFDRIRSAADFQRIYRQILCIALILHVSVQLS